MIEGRNGKALVRLKAWKGWSLKIMGEAEKELLFYSIGRVPPPPSPQKISQNGHTTKLGKPLKMALVLLLASLEPT